MCIRDRIKSRHPSPKLDGSHLQRREELKTRPGMFGHAGFCQPRHEQRSTPFAARQRRDSDVAEHPIDRLKHPVTTYKLNGEESTQKVFHRLLGAANARPDGYNIVLQGDVTSLAKMTANERRKVLDNVAGVTSYDDEIRKANKQKDMVENYLDRIGLLEKEQLELSLIHISEPTRP